MNNRTVAFGSALLIYPAALLVLVPLWFAVAVVQAVREKMKVRRYALRRLRHG